MDLDRRTLLQLGSLVGASLILPASSADSIATSPDGLLIKNATSSVLGQALSLMDLQAKSRARIKSLFN
ncbi:MULTISPECIES: hypothetical protein [Pseudomonas]|uniref:hypothetical protein n=1 Tax=Pseudomonas TaxID=286 RepID=UPI001E5658E7|nr:MULTISPECIES: hypothetical protein [Pseudomonas]MCE0952424.1 hypothetical protein [Pseudomonas asiatica]MDF3930535.1 hypothetical protein [Pseudomonas putida]